MIGRYVVSEQLVCRCGFFAFIVVVLSVVVCAATHGFRHSHSTWVPPSLHSLTCMISMHVVSVQLTCRCCGLPVHFVKARRCLPVAHFLRHFYFVLCNSHSTFSHWWSAARVECTQLTCSCCKLGIRVVVLYVAVCAATQFLRRSHFAW